MPIKNPHAQVILEPQRICLYVSQVLDLKGNLLHDSGMQALCEVSVYLCGYGAAQWVPCRIERSSLMCDCVMKCEKAYAAQKEQ